MIGPVDATLPQEVTAAVYSWHELFARYGVHPLIRRQFEAKDLPLIADPRIKEIPIEECNEPLVDVANSANRRIQMLPDPAKPFGSPDCNSGLPKASLMRKSLYDRLERLISCLDALAPAFGYKVGQLSIRVFEGLRDLATQQMLYDKKVLKF